MTTVEKIKAKILDLAIRGKLVPQNPDDEPASVLLGRIKAEKAKLVKAGKIKKDKNPSEIVVGSDGATYEKFADGMTKDISDEIPFELPQGWAWARLGVIFDVARGGSPRPIKAYITTSDDGLNWIKIGDATIGSKYIFSTEQKIRPDGLKKTRAVYSGDLLLTNSMSFGHPYILKTSGCIHDGWLVLHPLDDKINKEFFYYLLSSKFAYSQFAKAASGGVVRNLNTDKVIATIFPLPSPSEQKRIVAKIEELFAYADKIGKASDGIAQVAQRLDKKILDLAIRGQLVPQDPNDEPASELIKRIEAAKKATEKGRKSSRAAASDRPAYETNPPFDIPDSWEWVKLGNLVKIIAGVSYQKDNVTTSGVRILRGGNIKEDANIHLFDDDVFLPLSYANEESTIHSGDIVIVASTGSSAVIGRPAVAKESLPGIQIGAFLRIVRPVVDEVESWMPVLFLGDYYRRHIRGKSKGTNIKNLKAEYLSDLVIPLPPVAEQKRIVAKIEELRAMTRSLTK